MSIAEALLPEFDQEMANTRKTLERVPDDKLNWKPHPKSASFGQLGTHLATMPGWTLEAIGKESVDVAPPGEQPQAPEMLKSTKELVDRFDENVAKARAAIAGATDEHLFKDWTLLAGGRVILTMPRAAVIRSFVLNHTVHHRAQLGVYLRLNDIAVPAIYGPSADEGEM
jgi:uncharacterized damage-inducible protein DinB